MKQIAGIDIGNGYVKAQCKTTYDAKPTLLDCPSCVAYVDSTHDNRLDITKENINTLMDNIDCTIDSPMITGLDTGRIWVGKRAIASGAPLREFNIHNTTPKCKDALNAMLLFSTIATQAIQATYNKKQSVPTTISVNTTLMNALPIEDVTPYRQEYIQSLMASPHTVTVHTFTHDIVVTITIDKADVLPEGVAGQFAIATLGVPFLDAALQSARKQFPQLSNEYTGELLSRCTNTIGIDVGEGTTNFPVFQDGKANLEASRSINKGYGSALTGVVNALRNTPYAFDSRKDVADFLLSDSDTPSHRRIKQVVQEELDKQINILVRDIVREFSSVFARVGLRTDVIYIYGGGAGSIQKVLYQAIVKACALSSDFALPVIYLDVNYSRNLNRTGLYKVACSLK